MGRALGALLLLPALAAAQNQDVQRALIQRDQQAESFNLQLRQSQRELQGSAADAARSLDNLNERQLRDVRPDYTIAPELRPYERDTLARERAFSLPPPVVRQPPPPAPLPAVPERTPPPGML